SAQQIRDKLTNHLATDNDNQKQDELLLTSDNEKEKLKIKSDNLFFIKSVGNYIEVYFKKDNTIDSRILRSSLKRVEDYLQGNRNFCRSHRAYLVNLNNIVNISGNSQGYELEFRELDKRVPVSRKYSKNLRDLII
ncbi:MAG: LytTR family DNA-binding domain-containing protein, partial [Calditrichaceae bacterium]